MRERRRAKPSVGFVAVCIVHVLAISFFVWGFGTPPLDRVWTLHHLLKIGATEQLDPDDKALLQSAMTRHERLAENLIGDGQVGIISAHMDGWVETRWVTIIRTPEATERTIELDVQTPKDVLPFSLKVYGNNWNKSIDITKQGFVEIAVPKPPGTPEIIELHFKGEGMESDPSVLGTKIRFGGLE